MDVTQTHTAHEFKHERPLISCRFDPSGKHVFAGSEDFQVWRFQTADGAKVPLNTDSWVRGMAFSKDGKASVATATF